MKNLLHPFKLTPGALIGALVVLMLLVLAACGDTAPTVAPSSGTGAAPAATPAGGTDMSAETATAGAQSSADTASQPATGSGSGAAVQATLREWAIDLSTKEVPAGKVTFTVTNQGQMPHNLTVIGSGGRIGATSIFPSSAGAQTLEVDLQPGTYTLMCSLPGHAQRGQQTTLTVK